MANLSAGCPCARIDLFRGHVAPVQSVLRARGLDAEQSLALVGGERRAWGIFSWFYLPPYMLKNVIRPSTAFFIAIAAFCEEGHLY